MGERERGMSHIGGAGGVDAFLGKGTKVNGKLILEGSGRIEGHIEGEISAHETLTIGEGAVVNAKVSGTTIIIDGRVTGDVVARQRLELRPSAHVQGNITAPSLVVHEGAILNGQCSMGGADTAYAHTVEGTATESLDSARDASLQVSSAFVR